MSSHLLAFLLSAEKLDSVPQKVVSVNVSAIQGCNHFAMYYITYRGQHWFSI